MDTFKNRSFFVIFVILWGSLTLWNLFTPAKEFSESENRFLKAFPTFTVDTLLDGKFTGDIETYLNDHFAGRPYWVSAQSMIEYISGKREINGVYIGKDKMLLANVAAPDMDVTAKNIAGINKFAEQYQIPTYMMLIPSSTDIQKEKLPKFAAGWDEKAYIDNVYAGLDASVAPIDVYSELDTFAFDGLYYNTDHHWTALGARRVGYFMLSRAMKLPTALADFEKTEVSHNFYGTFHSKTGLPLVEPDSMQVYQSGTVKSYEIFDGKETTTRDSIYFDEFLDKKDKYSYFLGQVQPIVTIKTESESSRKLIIFKDSYAHCLVPMMLDDFSEIRLIDLRFANPMTIGEQMEAENYDEALFIYSTDVFSHQLGAGILRIDNG